MPIPNEKSIRLHASFTRLDAAERMVYGYASTGAIDSEDTEFEPSWWPQAIAGYKQTRSLSAMHERPNIGTVPILEVRPEGLWIGARIDDLDEWALCKNGTYDGFSIEFFAWDHKLKTVDGKRIKHYTKFVLTDITVGYPVSNPETTFQLIGRLQVEKDAPWDFDWSKNTQEIVDLFGFEGLRTATLYQDPNTAPDAIESYRLPIAKVTHGKLTTYRMAVYAAMAVLNGARTGENYTDKEKEEIYNRIKPIYASFNEKAPELRLQTGGIKMSKFTEALEAFFKNMTGKEATVDEKKELSAMETRLDAEKDKSDLQKSVEAFSTRLEKLETTDKEASSKKEVEEASKKVTEFIETVGKRLDVLEKSASKSKQPDDTEKSGEQTVDKGARTSAGMNDFIRTAAGAAPPKEEEE